MIEILRVIEDADKPIGARAISDILSERGYEIGERAVRYNLKILDELGFTRKHGYTGRDVTALGKREMNCALVNDRIGFVNTRIEEFMYRTTFDPVDGGDVVVNTSFIKKQDFERVADILLRVYLAGYAVSGRVLVADEGEEMTSNVVPQGHLGIATICSITFDGLLLRAGIPVNTTFAGVAEVRRGEITEFSELIAYAGTSVDPMRAFLARRIARVTETVATGSGRVLANVREIPTTAADAAHRVMLQSRAAGIGGLIKMGEPGQPIFGCPVSPGKVGVVITAGVNGPAAVEDVRIPITTTPISSLADYSQMTTLH